MYSISLLVQQYVYISKHCDIGHLFCTDMQSRYLLNFLLGSEKVCDVCHVSQTQHKNVGYE